MAKRELEAIVLCSYQAVSYFGGTHIMTQVSLPDRLEFMVQPRESPATMLVCNIETSMVQSQTDIDDIREYVEFVEEPAEALASLLRDLGLGSARVGVELRRLPVAAGDDVRRSLPSVELVGIDNDVEVAQSNKTRDEIKSLEVGAEATLQAVLAAAAAATTETTEVAFCGDVYARLAAAGGVPTFLVFASGERTLQAHAEAVDAPFEPGAIWRIDVGARFDNVINSDIARTGVVGEPTPEQESLLRALRATQDAGYSVIEPGRPACDVFEAVKAEFGRQGLDFWMPHVGHGLGIGLHEAPLLEPANDTPLEVGMVLNVEPMARIYDRKECYHVEDLAEVTEDGFRLLTQPQDSLIRIPTQ
ncbi:MAG: M24 family metallopeptidase [Gaiellaceae bacterium MAG52_C11]|nr:M24 family metallopeptidase [Candidatus Gaiellasilicea maunaloa]